MIMRWNNAPAKCRLAAQALKGSEITAWKLQLDAEIEVTALQKTDQTQPLTGMIIELLTLHQDGTSKRYLEDTHASDCCS